MLQSDLSSYINLRKYLDKDVFKFNPYGICEANKIIEGEPLSIGFHVYSLTSSHKDTRVVDNF